MATLPKRNVVVARPRFHIAPRYRVLLFDDSIHNKKEVSRILMRVIKDMSFEEATSKMLEAHTSGNSVVRVCPQDRAEEYCGGLRGHGLTSSIEPA